MRCLFQYFKISECWFITLLGPDFPKPKKRTKMTSVIAVSKTVSLQESVWHSFYNYKWQDIIVQCRLKKKLIVHFHSDSFLDIFLSCAVLLHIS